MKGDPELTIIVPIYNVEKYLTKCLLSIQNQTFKDFECLMIDDCSPDNSYKICKQFEQTDSRFKYIKKAKNEGLGFARNTGLDKAKGAYVAFIDSDDTIEPDFCTTLLPYAQKYGAVRCAMKIVDINGNIKSYWPVAEGLFKPEDMKLWSDNLHDAGYTTCALYKREVLDKHKVRFTKCPYREDSLFSFELFAKHQNLYMLNKYLYNYFKRDTNTLSGKNSMTKERALAYLTAVHSLLEKLKKLDSYKYLKNIIIANTSQSCFIRSLCAEEYNEFFPQYAYIDLVVPYVDCTDSSWQELFKQYSPSFTSLEVNDLNRFRGQANFFRYFFRSVEKNMPFINNIFLLVASKSQVPEWLDQTKVKIITHEQFIPQEFLPTFNSGTIEMFLWNIPGLSNRFIYANDDFYMLNKTTPESFYQDNFCKINIVKESVNASTTDMWRTMCYNNYRLIMGDTATPDYLRYDHEFRPYYKPDMIECFKKYKRQIIGSISQFRSSKNLTCFLFNLYTRKLGYELASTLKQGYLCSTSGARTIEQALKQDYVCLNDTNPNINLYDNTQIRSYFYSKFNNKSKYELTDCPELVVINTNKLANSYANTQASFALSSPKQKQNNSYQKKPSIKIETHSSHKSNYYLYF